MPITELALLHLTPGTTPESPTLRTNLSHAKTVLQNYTNRAFYYMQQISDPSCIYVVGEWDSLDQHLNDFIPSAENQALLESLKDYITVDSNLEHLDVPNAELPLPRGGREMERARRGEVVWSITHYTIKSGNREAFEVEFREMKEKLDRFAGEGGVGGGWCVGKKEGEDDVFVTMFSWRSVAEYERFGKGKEGRVSAVTGECVEKMDVRHVRLVDI
ncbi:uncharacterized protein J4E84_008921 [Alternaria hordeiaustralica]|uniref:uncharacterized protein n=1 Tax=Alternaria hordeiaustralica TaxID=1187925 RepID=UPI0020C1E7B7|nr:uncharacterized protein J4E84_008921 [Alternaria hordeiaustralica]KAI4677974.1 hypothetical protein J4E84_008921 [Alternaria hordeiaustralica]